MKKNSGLSSLLLLAVLGGLSPLASADYPIASHRYLADPGSLVHNGRVYLYCSNDDDNAPDEKGGYIMKSIVCVSSADMKNWTDHGVVLEVPKNAAWAGRSWAPSPIERDGKFFLYFGNGGNGIGVASAPSPIGPFSDAKGSKLIESNTPGVQPAQNMWLFDPMAFIDDDGQAYLYFGGNGESNVRITKLNRDMISINGPAMAMTAPAFFEAAWMHKRNGVYYFSYSTNPRAQLRIDYMKSSSPISGFTYAGILAPQPPENNNNNHQAIFRLQGQWYHAFHNRIVARQAKVLPTYKRNLGVERLIHKDDGSIEPVIYTPDGVAQIAPLNPYARVEAETMNAQNGIETEPCSEGGMNVTAMQNGDWIKIKGVDFGAEGAKSFSARVASATQGGKIELRLGSPTGTLIGTCDTLGTGGGQNWKSSKCQVTGATGMQDLYLTFTGDNTCLLNIDWWQFSTKEG